MRLSERSGPRQKGAKEGHDRSLKRSKLELQSESVVAVGPEVDNHLEFPFEVAFGLPWDYEGSIRQACKVGHPASHSSSVPWELQGSIDKAAEWTAEQMAKYRIDWCRKWLKRCTELES